MTDERATIFCTQCGEAVQPGWGFCADCGTPVLQPSPLPARQTGASTPLDELPTQSAPRDGGSPRFAGSPDQPDPAAGWGEPLDDAEGWGYSSVDPAWPAADASADPPTAQLSQAPARRPARPTADSVPATFGQRVGARLIDGIILTLVAFAVMAITYVAVIAPDVRSTSDSDRFAGAISLLLLYFLWGTLGVIPGILYFSLSESGDTGQTIGKRALKIRVERAEGGRLGFGRAIGRTIANALGAVPLGLGQLAMLWNRDRRTWPDRWTSTRVAADAQARNAPFALQPLVVATAACLVILLGIPAGIRLASRDSRSISSTAPAPSTSAAPSAVQGSTTRPGPTSPTDVAAVDPCSLSSAADVRAALGVSVRPGVAEAQDPRLADDPTLGMKSVGRKKCTFAIPGQAGLSPQLYLTTAAIIFSETYTTSDGAKAAFSNFRGLAEAANEPDATPFGPVGPAKLDRGFVNDLSLGEGGFAYWDVSRWSSAPPNSTATTAPGGDPKSEIGFMGVEFVQGRTCVLVAVNGRIGDPADFPVIKRDVQAKLIELARSASRRMPAS